MSVPSRLKFPASWRTSIELLEITKKTRTGSFFALPLTIATWLRYAADVLNCLSPGVRTTKAKRALAAVLEAAEKPLTVAEILSLLDKQLSINKTTVYRFLDVAVRSGELSEVDFGDGQKRYEHTHGTHHHHAVCTACSKVSEIEIEPEIERLMQHISQKSGFAIDRHVVEFFGRCRACV